MEPVKNKQEKKETLGLDHLLSHLNLIHTKTTRLSLDEIAAVFRQLHTELPYSSHITTPALAMALMADTPLQKSKLTLNEVIDALGKLLCDPSQTDNIANLVQTYLQARKKTEKEYATAISSLVFNEADLQRFPETAKPLLKKISQSILEKIINEKQSRKIIGHQPLSLLEMIDPILHHKSSNPELEKLKLSHADAFRTAIHQIAQTGYEKICDDTKLTSILHEKHAAFESFFSALLELIPPSSQLEKCQNMLRFAQRDKNQKHELLMKHLEAYLQELDPKSSLGHLFLQLRLRFSDNLRKKLALTEHDITLYASEAALQQAHAEVYTDIENDMLATETLLNICNNLEKNYLKSSFRRMVGRSALTPIEACLSNILLGPFITKTNPVTLETQSIREGGYPQKLISEIYEELISGLKQVHSNASGLFANDLKTELNDAIEKLTKAKAQIKITPVKLASINVQTSSTATVTTTQSTLESLVTPKITTETTSNAETTTNEPTKSTAETAQNLQTEIPQEKMTTPLAIEPDSNTAQPTEIEPEIILEKITAKPLAIELEPDNTEEATTAPSTTAEPEITLEKTTIKPLAVDFDTDHTDENITTSSTEAEPDVTLEKATTKPLDVEFVTDHTEESTTTPNTNIEPEITLEKISVKPLDINFDSDIPEENTQENATTTIPEPTTSSESTSAPADLNNVDPEALEAGLSIMQNYELGEFKPAVIDAWKHMISLSTDANDELHAEALGSDNEIHLYVICDLTQQISALTQADLSEEKKSQVQALKTQLLQGLSNPVIPENWAYFEGIQRDQIDRTLSDLQQH